MILSEVASLSFITPSSLSWPADGSLKKPGKDLKRCFYFNVVTSSLEEFFLPSVTISVKKSSVPGYSYKFLCFQGLTMQIVLMQALMRFFFILNSGFFSH